MTYTDSEEHHISQAWQQHAYLFSHLTRYSQHALLVFAPISKGNTFFIDYAIRISPGLQAKTIVAEANDTVGSVNKKIADILNCDMPNALRDLMSHPLKDAIVQDQTLALVVKEAHLLNADAIVFLMSLVESSSLSQKAWLLILSGEPSLEKTWEHPSLSEYKTRIVTMKLEPETLKSASTC